MPRFLRETMLVTRRELHALATQPLFYILCGVFFVVAAYAYLSLLVTFSQDGARAEAQMSANVTQSVIRQTFYIVHFFLLVQIPLLTMRSVAEDRQTGALDLLQTTPLGEWPLLLGKFLGCWIGLALYLSLTMLFPFATSLVSDPEWPVAWCAFAALLLAAAAYVAIGIFFSATTESQVVSAVFSYVALFLLVMLSSLADLSKNTALVDLAKTFSVVPHVEAFLKGSIGAINLLYFPMLAVLFLFMTARLLEARRWRA